MSQPPLDEAHLRSWIGRQERSEHDIGEDFCRRFLATFDDETAPWTAGALVPHLIHFCLPQAIVPTSALDRDGHPTRGGFLPPVPLPRRMWAGGEVHVHGDLHVGERLVRTSTIADVSVKAGRSGTLCFVTVKHRFTVGVRHVLDDVQSIVYRDEATRGAQASGPTPGPAPAGSQQRPIDPTSPFLFRYSALMFNAHRIHYDRDYATGVEGYPGLVVQGPLMATLMFRFATDLRGRRPDQFRYRGESPLFDTEHFLVHASETAAGFDLWTSRAGGPAAMRSQATWLL